MEEEGEGSLSATFMTTFTAMQTGRWAARYVGRTDMQTGTQTQRFYYRDCCL